MKKEKFNKLAVQAGFTTHHGWPGELFSPNHCDNLNGNLEKFKNLLLDEVIKELNALSGEIDLGLSTDVFVQIALKAAIEKVEGMK